MPSFKHIHTESGDFIEIKDGTNPTFQVSLSTFQQLEPDYELPADVPGALWQYYDQGVLYQVHTDSIFVNEDIPWTDGDTYISKVDLYQDEVSNPTQDLNIAKNIREQELANILTSKLAGGLDLFSTTMDSTLDISNQVIAYNAAGDVPSGFYIKDFNGDAVTLTLAQLNDYLSGMAEIQWVMQQNSDALSQEIQDATSIIEVNAIDLTVGWATVPYTPA
jgi:hypothetical protein